MSQDKNNTHAGHRDRVRDKFIQNGIDSFNPHEILELLLFYAVPRRDTNELAHRLINKCGSLSAVFDAPIEILQECGLSKSGATLLKLVPDLSRIYMLDKYESDDKVITEENVGTRIVQAFVGRNEETVLALLLDAKGREQYFGIVNTGSIRACEIYVRKIIELTMRYNSASVILAHNHPSGVAIPSTADIETTRSVQQLLSLVGVRLLDHIIVADLDYVSMASTELFSDIFN